MDEHNTSEGAGGIDSSAVVVTSTEEDVVPTGSHRGDNAFIGQRSLRPFVWVGVLIVAAFVAIAVVATNDNGQSSMGSAVDGVCSGGHSPSVFGVDVGSGVPRWQFCSAAPAFAFVLAATTESVFVAVG